MTSESTRLPWRVAGARPPPRRLSTMDRPAVMRHFLALPASDRYLRFGGHRSDSAIEAYVTRIDFGDDVVFGASEDGLSLAGVAHLTRGARHAELGLSVLPGHRNRGVGRSLLHRSCVHARNWGAPALFMYCLPGNGTMIRLARSLDMRIAWTAGDAEAWLELPPPDAWSFAAASLAACASQIDYLQQLQFVVQELFACAPRVAVRA